jgi:hypothetical protein
MSVRAAIFLPGTMPSFISSNNIGRLKFGTGSVSPVMLCGGLTIGNCNGYGGGLSYATQCQFSYNKALNWTQPILTYSNSLILSEAVNVVARLSGASTSSLYVFGGGTCNVGHNSNVYKLTGSTWSLQSSSVPYGSRSQMPVLVVNAIWNRTNGFLLLGGTDTAVVYNDVWFSPDGASWTMVTNHANWPARQSMAASTVGDATRVIIAGGMNQAETTIYGDVWISDSTFLNWQELSPIYSGFSRAGGSMFAIGSNLFFTAGRDSSAIHYNDIWVTPNQGNTWLQVVNNAEFSPRAHFAITVESNTIVIGGGFKCTNRNDPTCLVQDVWVGYLG